MSSRNRRNQGNPDADMFTAANNAPEAPSLAEITHNIYGGDPNRGPLEGRLGKGISANPLPINDIYPDRRQPRRVIPSVVLEHWDGGMENLFSVWTALIRKLGSTIDIAELIRAKIKEAPAIDASISIDDPPRAHPVEGTLIGIIDLAASIQRDGLLNPISVVPFNNVYMLETGERRWLAYHLLYQLTQDKKWAKIPAQISTQFSVWRQASENNVRNGLNAIGRARQFALLLMDIWQEHDRDFRAISYFEHEQDFYAQVADPKEFRVPYGTNEKLMAAMGVNDRTTLSELRALLRLPEPIWTRADDFSWPHETLHKLSQLDEGEALALVDSALQSTAEIVVDSDNLADPIVGIHDNLNHARKSEKQPVPRVSSAALESRRFVAGARKLGRAIDMGVRIRDNKRNEALQEIAALRTWLDEAERILNKRRK